MVVKRAVALGLLSLCFCFACSAATHPLDAELEKCKRDGEDTWKTIECVDAVREKWREELGRSCDELMDMLPKDGQLLLRNGQDAWEQWAEAESKLLSAIHMAIYDNLDGGKVWLVHGATARMDLFRERALEIAAYVDERREGEVLADGIAVDEPLDDLLIGKRHEMIGSALGGRYKSDTARNLRLWEKHREEEVAFIAWFRGKTDDDAFVRRTRFEMDAARLKTLESLVKNLQSAFLLTRT